MGWSGFKITYLSRHEGFLSKRDHYILLVVVTEPLERAYQFLVVLVNSAIRGNVTQTDG